MSDDHHSVGRRAFLALTGLAAMALAGCQTSGAPEPTPTTAERETDSATARPTRQPTRTNTPGAATATEPPTESATETPTTPTAAERSLASLSFEGEWFDTHAHWRMADTFNYDDYATEDLTARQAEHGVGATVLFVTRRPFVNAYQETVETLATPDVDYLPFFFPGGFRSARQRRGFFDEMHPIDHGIGEVTFYAGREQGKALTDDPFPEYFQLAAEEDLVLMLHPTEQQADGLGPMLEQYPEATLLLHGHELLGTGDHLRALLREHDNLYWTYDTATMLGGLTVRAAGKSDFIDRFEADRDRYRRRVTQRLPPLLEAAPDRVMWGTDIVADWHVDPDVYSRLLAFSEDVRDALPTEHRDPFAYENAVTLFGG